MSKNLVLTGMMGVGKSTIGKSLALKLAYGFIDVDKVIEMVSHIKAKKYNFIKNPGKQRWGFIAQDLPENVHQPLLSGSEDKMYSVNYLELTALIPSLCKKIMELEAKLA